MAKKQQQQKKNNNNNEELNKKRKRQVEEEEEAPEVEEESTHTEEEEDEVDNEEMQDESDDDADDDDDSEDNEEDDNDEDDESSEQKSSSEDGRDQSTGEPPKKMTKREKKDQVIEKKRLKNPNIDKAVSCKRIWEELLQHVSRNSRRGERPKDEKSLRFLNQIVEYLREDWNRFACQHDMSRVVQTVLKLGTDEQVLEVFRALKPNLKSLAKEKFGHNIVMKLLTYVLDKSRFSEEQDSTKTNKNSKSKNGSNHKSDKNDNKSTEKTKMADAIRKEFFDELFKGQMKLMMKQKFPATVIDHAFRTVWTPAERVLYLQEFYGSDFWLSDISSIQNTNLHTVSLKDKLAEFPGKRTPVVQSLSAVVTKIVEKSLFDLELAQKLILDFFENGEPGQIQNVIYDLCEKDAIPFIFHTLFGCRIAIFCTAYGAARDRKRIIKSFCQNTAEGNEDSIVLKTAKVFYGSIFLRYLLSVTDDTKKSKNLLKDIEKNMLEFLSDKHGQKVILYLFNREHKTCNENGDLQLLNPVLREDILPRTNNEGKRVVSMKPTEVIFKELAEYMAPHVSETLYNNITLFGTDTAQHVAYEALTKPVFPNKKKLFEKLVNAVTGDIFNLMQDKNSASIASKVLSLLVRSQKVDQISDAYPSFARMLFDKLVLDNKLVSFIVDKKGGFIVAAILTAGDDGGDKQLGEELNKELMKCFEQIKKAFEQKSEPPLKFLVSVFSKRNNLTVEGLVTNNKGKQQEQNNKKKAANNKDNNKAANNGKNDGNSKKATAASNNKNAPAAKTNNNTNSNNKKGGNKKK